MLTLNIFKLLSFKEEILFTRDDDASWDALIASSKRFLTSYFFFSIFKFVFERLGMLLYFGILL
jgi:hypothetical protein